MRATLGLGTASVLAGAVERVVRAPVPRRVAGAAAFATGAAMEHRALGVPIGAAALWPAFARPRRVQHPLATASALASGTALALATRRLWPLAPHEAADLSSALTRVDQEPSPDGRGLCIVVNEAAGPAISRSPGQALREALPGAEIIVVEEADDLGGVLDRAARSSLAIGVAGGDGSINAAAQTAAAAGKPLVIVPAGTLNHLARDLGLISVDDAVTAVRHGQTVAIDLASIDDRAFLNTASFGSYVDLVDARRRLESVIGKWPAVIVALGRVLRASELVDVELDGRRRQVWMVFVGNCRYEPSGFTPSWRPRLDDGQLDIRIVDGAAPWSRARLVLALVTGTLGRCRSYEQRAAASLEVRSLQGPLRLARDGETFDGSEHFTVAKCDQPLAVYVPYR